MSLTTQPESQKKTNAYDVTDAAEWESYARYRPEYPEQLFDRVYGFHEANGGVFDIAHDAGCGPGMAAATLARSFKHVICSDFSRQAVDAAEKRLTTSLSLAEGRETDFTFRQSAAEDMATWLKPNSVDLVAMSECLHWTDVPKTTKAVLEVLKPGGTLAVWYYCNVIFPDNKDVQQVNQDILEHWCGQRIEYSKESARTMWVEQTGYDCVAFPESEGWAPGTRRIKFNTNQSEEVWIRSKTRPWMRYPKQIGENDVLEYVEDAKEWEYEFDLDWFRGSFQSIFPRLDEDYLNSQLKRMEVALGPERKTKALWPLSLILARKKREGE